MPAAPKPELETVRLPALISASERPGSSNLTAEAVSTLARAQKEVRAARIKAGLLSDAAEGWITLRSEFRSDPAKLRDDKAKIIFLSNASAALKELSGTLHSAEEKILQYQSSPQNRELSNHVASMVADARLILSLIDKPAQLKTLLTGTNDAALKPYILAANRFAPKATTEIVAQLLLLDCEGKQKQEAERHTASRITLIAAWDAELGKRIRTRLEAPRRHE